MPSKIPITSVRLEEPYYSKIRYIAENNDRKLNDEIKMVIKKHIKEYESEYGEIKIEE